MFCVSKVLESHVCVTHIYMSTMREPSTCWPVHTVVPACKCTACQEAASITGCCSRIWGGPFGGGRATGCGWVGASTYMGAGYVWVATYTHINLIVILPFSLFFREC